MNTLDDSAVIGIDGGGTTCRVALVRHGRRFEARSGPANVTSDLRGALEAIRAGLDDVAGQAGLRPGDLRPLTAYAGIAGVTGPVVARAVAQALPLDALVVEDDRRAALVGALGDADGADGAVAGIGTGSFLACRSGGAVRFGGGYGLVLGDEASGAWLGRALLSRVLHVVDGLEADSPLTGRTRAQFPDTAAIIGFARDATAADFARLAPDILTGAAQHDPAACALMRAGADYLERALAAVGWRDGMPICLLGGIGGHYGAFLSGAHARCLIAARGTALDGAVTLATAIADAARGCGGTDGRSGETDG